MRQRPSVIWRTIATPVVLIVALLAIAALTYQFGSRAFNRTVVEMFINIMVVAGLYVFVGNSGLLSFGHISFMCLGAYMTAWLTIPPMMKSVTLKGLPAWLLHTQLPMWVATPISGVFAALFALIVGLRERLIALVVSAVIIGLAGALYAHFLSIVHPGSFYLRTTFITLSMLVVGGMSSLSGAVSGVVVISALIEMFRDLERGVSLGGLTIALPIGVQEIAIGIITIVILMYLPTGVTPNRAI